MIVRVITKTAIAYVSFDLTRKFGVWGNHEQSEHLYNSISTSVSPCCKKMKEKLPFEMPLLPQTGEMRFLAKHYYNQGVKSSIHFIYMLPCYTGQLVKKTKDAVTKALEAPPPAN